MSDSSATESRSGSPGVERLLSCAREGDEQQLGRLLTLYRNYLTILATTQLDARLRRRISPSDLVQEAMLGAYRDFPKFRGNSERELLGWLRQILANQLADAVRGLTRAKRDVTRERSLDHELNDSFSRVDGWLAAAQSSPSQQVVRAEELVHLANALTGLPSAQREAIVLHHLQGLPLAEVANQLEKSPAAVAGLLHRGLKGLREVMSESGTNISSFH